MGEIPVPKTCGHRRCRVAAFRFNTGGVFTFAEHNCILEECPGRAAFRGGRDSATVSGYPSMADTVEVNVDHERHIVRQRLVGDVSAEDASRLRELTADAVAGMKDPGRVGIVADMREMGKMEPAARRLLIDTLERENVVRLAVYSERPYIRVSMRLFAFLPRMKKLRAFSDEESALAWAMGASQT